MNEIWILAYILVTLVNGEINYEPQQIEVSSLQVCLQTKDQMGEYRVSNQQRHAIISSTDEANDTHRFQGIVCQRKDADD